jgi:DNA primase
LSEDIVQRLSSQPELYKSLIGFQVRRESGRQWECDCPGCGGKKKLSLNIENSTWTCFKCQSKGNAITYYAQQHGITTKEAWAELMKALGLWTDTMPKDSKSQGSKNKKSEKAKTETKQESKQQEQTPIMAADPIREAVYERLIDLTPLTADDLQNLRKDRGFSDELIKSLRFVSCGPHMAEIIQKLRDEFPEDALIASGILVSVKGTVIAQKQLLESRLLIPYLNEDGRIYHIRPHKLGFKDQPSEPYSAYLLRSRPDQIVLTEGEFKAAALMQWGFPAAAIPGISSFAKTNFERLVQMLRNFGTKRITIIFDSEEKGNPAYKNYKPEPFDRYDTQFWSYQMAVQLGKEGFNVRIGWLPEEWRVEGKVDFDMALAQGRSREDIARVIFDAKTPAEFRDSLSDEAKKVIERKLSRQYAKAKVKRDWNRYIAFRESPRGRWEEPISNFVITIKASLFEADTVIRSIVLTNQYGEESEPFHMEPAAMAGVADFRKFLLARGNYLFSGSIEDLQNIWEFEFIRDTGQRIYLPERIGRIEKDLWLFGNLAIYKGRPYYPDEDGTIWISKNGNQIGYRPQAMEFNSKNDSTGALPVLSSRVVNIKEVAAKMRKNIGGFEPNMMIGWVIATIFSDDIFKEYKALPILFPHGKRESGKSTVMRWIMCFFGMDAEGVSAGANTTLNGVVRPISYYSSLGVWFDEYRNDLGCTNKDGLFRSAFNRQSSGKGTATSFQTKSFRVRATLAISGEEIPKDSGLFTRLIPLQINAYKRDREPYKWIVDHRHDFSGFVFDLIMRYEQLLPVILSSIAKLKDALLIQGISDRTAENWAICAGAYWAVVEQDKDFAIWVQKECQQIKIAADDSHMLALFWDDVNVMVAEGNIDTGYIRIDDDLMSIWFSGVYDRWSEHYRKRTGKEPFNSATILQYLQGEPYYVDIKNCRIKGAVRKSHRVNIKNAPESIQEIVQTISEKQLGISSY